MRFVARLSCAIGCVLSLGACATLAGISDNASETNGTTVLAPSKSGDQRTDANIMIVGSLDFGNVPCGTEAGGHSITIKNSGGTATDYTINLPTGTPFRIDGALKGSIGAGETLTLNVYAKPITAAKASTDIVVSAGSALQAVTATTQGAGATFEITPPLVSFGQVRMQSGAGPTDITVKNGGSTPLLVQGFDTSPDFTLDLGATLPFTVAAGGTGTIKASFVGGAESAPLHSDLKPHINQVLCGPTPTLALEGQRVNSDVLFSSGDFGNVNCSSNPAGKDITISNYSTSALTFTASLMTGTAFQLGTPSGTLLAGSSATPSTAKVHVTPKSTGTTLGAFSDTLAINITGVAPPSGGPRTIPITMNVHGAVLTITPVSITNFSSDGNHTDTKTFNVKNTGTDPVGLDWNLVRNSGGPAWSASPPGTIQVGGNGANGSIDFKPQDQGTGTATLGVDFTFGAAVCNNIPDIKLQGVRP